MTEEKVQINEDWVHCSWCDKYVYKKNRKITTKICPAALDRYSDTICRLCLKEALRKDKQVEAMEEGMV